MIIYRRIILLTGIVWQNNRLRSIKDINIFNQSSSEDKRSPEQKIQSTTKWRRSSGNTRRFFCLIISCKFAASDATFVFIQATQVWQATITSQAEQNVRYSIHCSAQAQQRWRRDWSNYVLTPCVWNCNSCCLCEISQAWSSANEDQTRLEL